MLNAMPHPCYNCQRLVHGFCCRPQGMCSHPKRVQAFIDWEKEFAEKRKEWEASRKFNLRSK
jgi:hypothetical protein